MKRILCFVTLMITLPLARAQQPERIYGNARVHKSISYYKEQSAAWKKVVDENPKDVNAWYNYYYANRTLLFNDHTDQRPREEREAEIKKLIDDMGMNIPETYEYNLCKWMAGGFDTSLLPYLEKAVKLGPDRTEHLDYMINLGEIDRDMEKRHFYAKKKFEAGDISTGMMYYNHNVVAGTAPNAILITVGDNDTYPIWVLQAQGFRKDITVINLSLIQIDQYREKLFKELGIGPWDMHWGTSPDSAKTHKERFNKEIIRHIAANKKHYPVYVALTAAGCEPYIEHIKENLYLCGLAYLYNTEPLDNIAIMKRNFEQHYALDYIEHAFYSDISTELVGEINRNYAVPMLKLFDHYKASGDVQKQLWIKDKLLFISKGTPDEEEVKKHLSQS